MKIAFVISNRFWGGVKTWMIEYGRQLIEQGDEVYFFARDPRFVEAAKEAGGQAFQIRFGADYNPLTIRRFRRYFLDFGIEVACLNQQKELRSAGIAAKMLGIPVVQRVGLPGDITHKLNQKLSQYLVVDRILVTSPWIQAELSRRFAFVPASKINCVYNGKPITAPARRDKPDHLRFVIASRLDPGKGHATLVEAFHRVRQAGYENFSCDIFGEGKCRSGIESQIAALGLGDKVRLRGFCRDLAERLPGYDVGILASQVEGMANTALEYFAASLPCIFSDGVITGMGIPRLATDHQFYQFHYEDAEALAQRLRSHLDMPAGQYVARSEAAYQLASTLFNREDRVRELRAYFAAVAQGRTGVADFEQHYT